MPCKLLSTVLPNIMMTITGIYIILKQQYNTSLIYYLIMDSYNNSAYVLVMMHINNKM